LELNRSSYYSHNSSVENKLKKLEYELFICQRIYHIYLDSNGIYGSPKITALLRKEGIKISQKSVWQYMVILGIQSSVYSKFKHHFSSLTEKEKSLIINLIKDFPLTNINQV